MMVAISPLEDPAFDVDPDYGTWSHAELISALKAHRRTLRGFYRTIHLPNTQMAPGEKLASIASQCLLRQEEPDENGLVRYPTEDIATFIGMSDSSTNRYANAMIERFDAIKVPVEYKTKKKQTRELTYVDRDEPVWQAPWKVDLPEEKERVINGNGKECPRCKTYNLQITTRRLTYQEIQECECCGYKKISEVLRDEEHPTPLDPGEYIPPKKAHQAGDLFVAGKATQPEEPFADEDKKAQKSASLTLLDRVALEELQTYAQWVVWHYRSRDRQA